MNEEHQDNKFEYTYRAPTEKERKEIESIKRRYEISHSEREGNLNKLRQLDAKVKNTATCISLVIGIVGCLIFGLGFTMVIEWELWVAGVLISAAGCVPMALAYPIYMFLIEKGKQKYGEEILRLSDELLNE